MTDRGSRVPPGGELAGKIKPGSQSDHLVELADFLPTFLDLASASEPMQQVHGQSFLPQLLGKKGPSKEWVHIEYKKNRQIRTKEWIFTNRGNLIKVNQLGRRKTAPRRIRITSKSVKKCSGSLTESMKNKKKSIYFVSPS